MATLFKRDTAFSAFPTSLALCRKFAPWSEQEPPRAKLKTDLERLALSAPHLLSDIGFERDVAACSSTREVWRRGADRVNIVAGSVRVIASN